MSRLSAILAVKDSSSLAKSKNTVEVDSNRIGDECTMMPSAQGISARNAGAECMLINVPRQRQRSIEKIITLPQGIPSLAEVRSTTQTHYEPTGGHDRAVSYLLRLE